MDIRLQNKNINNVTYNNWPSLQAISRNSKNLRIQRSSITRLSPEPGSKINTDPVAMQVHKNRVMDRAKSSQKVGRAATSLDQEPTQHLMFAYLKKRSGMGKNFMETDKSWQMNKQKAIESLVKANGRNQFVRAKTNMRQRLDPSQLQEQTNMKYDPKGDRNSQTIENSEEKSAEKNLGAANRMRNVYNLDSYIKPSDLIA